MIATLEPTVERPLRDPVASDRRGLLIPGVTWDDYGKFQELFDRRRGFRLAYDRGALEIMSPSLAHDDDSRFLGDLVRAATMVLGLPARRGGSTTLRSELVRRGIEPDDCFWIENAPRMAGRRELDLAIDPPPDLGIEVDVASSSLDRFAIYAALGVRELWRLESGRLKEPVRLTFHVLQPDGTYAASPASLAFPMIRPEDLLEFVLAARDAVNQNAVIEAFQEWLRNPSATEP